MTTINYELMEALEGAFYRGRYSFDTISPGMRKTVAIDYIQHGPKLATLAVWGHDGEEAEIELTPQHLAELIGIAAHHLKGFVAPAREPAEVEHFEAWPDGYTLTFENAPRTGEDTIFEVSGTTNELELSLCNYTRKDSPDYHPALNGPVEELRSTLRGEQLQEFRAIVDHITAPSWDESKSPVPTVNNERAAKLLGEVLQDDYGRIVSVRITGEKNSYPVITVRTADGVTATGAVDHDIPPLLMLNPNHFRRGNQW
ncbi:hypothetical protein [Corynebacterium aquilae]|uniref:Uncharacterized protein n=1 Tax=Corynebacterium aquilae DSM 44791 TaxID=1431546 RepID=A0A1L7CHP0_9CORY|nr:hypothetical protein [Corynebacterium aquilae]APT85329.1 hypothetical protein CAQU_09930 [Corynebacterium aquilae DSM 44791]